jgi:hypothetical protein
MAIASLCLYNSIQKSRDRQYYVPLLCLSYSSSIVEVLLATSGLDYISETFTIIGNAKSNQQKKEPSFNC